MLLSINWLKEFVPFTGTIQELDDALTMLGLEVEEVIHPFEGIKPMVIGHVVECEKHPEAEKLSVCKVDVGEAELLNIVCGAPNVRKGLKVAVVKVGSEMPDGTKIKKTKLRGIPSMGMICSERELGLSDAHDGIMELPEELVPGASLVESLNLDEVVLDISITPNRADSLSVLGVAREVALAFDLPLTVPEYTLVESGDDCSDEVAIEITDADKCYCYYGRILEGAAIGQSPAWMRYRLVAVGLRPISNIVDVTNYIMMGFGQPLHAFDLDRLDGAKVIIDTAAEGEKFITLDEQERTLKATDLMIKDGSKSVALAGVMGGANSEIHDGSTRIFLESAVFQPASVRRTARRLGLSSDASFRFERGVDQLHCPKAMDRAAAMLAELTGATVRKGICKAEPKPWVAPELQFRPQRCRDLLGVDVDDSFCKATLEKLGCTISGADTADWTVVPPSNRLDYEREVDFIEEVARVYGMDRIEPVLPQVKRTLEARNDDCNEYEFWSLIKRWGCGLGLNEAINYSFVGHADLDLFNLPTDNRITIMNPLSSEQDAMRTELAPGLLQNLRYNLGHGNTGLRLFELAHIFEADESSDTTVRESGRLNILFYGDRFDSAYPRMTSEAEYADIKGCVEHLLAHLHVGEPSFTLAEDHVWLSPAVDVVVGNQKVGTIGRINPVIADAYNAKKDVWFADLDTDELSRLYVASCVKFSSLPVHQSAWNDLTVIAPITLNVQAIFDQVAATKLPLLEKMELIDVFVPEVSEDAEETRNLTFRLTFRHGSKTLKDKDVDKERKKVVKSLESALPVRI
ncbi:phenylalanine--tRNA ligase subunit beta [Halodesulfovibrio aestuarii]|uniref:Phenylalanine--tRNA ligase beta subunit n=1 Tax=Halodesulfovibrio aestuarii TaxID=126333 RepID=A0ABV4JTE5_9BACT